MFTIIGGDGNEYGPASADKLRAWIAAGRANLDTRAKVLGTDEWRRLGDFPEFAAPGDLPPMIEPATAAAGLAPSELAGRGTRLGARVIDWVLEIIVSIPGMILLGAQFIQVVVAAARGEKPDLEQLDLQQLGIGLGVLLCGTLTLAIIQIVMLSTRGQSIGKRILGLRVVRALDDGKAGFVHAWVMRELLITVIGAMLSMVIPILGLGLRFIFHVTDWCMIFRDDQRCLHDLIAGTKVVKVVKP